MLIAVNPLTLSEQLALEPLLVVKSPKSVELPVDAIVINWITLLPVKPLGPTSPPANIPLTLEDKPEKYLVEFNKSPKSAASPAEAIVT